MLYTIKATIHKADAPNEILHPKGFYYPDEKCKYIVLVGCIIRNHTVRRKELADCVTLTVKPVK